MNMLNLIVGVAFRHRIDQIDVAFIAACAPFYDEIKQVAQAAKTFQAEVDAGRAAWEQSTGDGYQYDYAADLGERLDDAAATLLTLRKAFTSLFYHQWERSMQRLTKTAKPLGHEDLVTALKMADVPLDEPGLEMLRLLVDTLMRNSARSGPRLHGLRPDLFEATFNPTADDLMAGKPHTGIDWSNQIVLTDSNIDTFVEILRNSSPR